MMLPITVDVSKYVPPFLMNQVGEIGPKDLSAFAFPPAPEKVEGYSFLEELAEKREDDILFGGTIDPADVPAAMMGVNAAVQAYAEMYSKMVPALHSPETEFEDETEGLGVSEVMYGLMSDNEKLSELTKLIGKLRFSVEGGEEGLANEAEADIRLLARQLPESHQVSRLIEAAKVSGSRGEKLADLCLKRSFHLIQEEYVKLGLVEAEIKEFETRETQ